MEKRSSCSTLRRKLLELEELQTECEQVDKQPTDIYSEIEDEETWNKEMESQANYTEKIVETLTRTEEYLAEKATGPSSSGNSASRSIVHERQNRLAELLEIPEQRIDQEIEMMRSALNTRPTLERQPEETFQPMERQPKETALLTPNIELSEILPRQRNQLQRPNQTGDNWMEHLQDNPLGGRPQEARYLPPLKLEHFDGDFAKWIEFASSFSACS